MEIKEIIKLLEIQKELHKHKIEIKKENISKSYFMAKHDFRVIEKYGRCL